MSANITNESVPEHLAGTRAGLFHILRGNSVVPQEDPMASAEVPHMTTHGGLAGGRSAIQAPLGLRESDTKQLADFLQKDEFCFYL